MMLRGCNPLGGKVTLLTQQKEQLYVITYKTWNRKGSDDKLGVLSRPTHLRESSQAGRTVILKARKAS